MSLARTDRRNAAHKEKDRLWRATVEESLAKVNEQIAEAEKMAALMPALYRERDFFQRELRLLDAPGGWTM